MNKNELCESPRVHKHAPVTEAQAVKQLLQLGLSLRRTNISDDEIASALRNQIEEEMLSGGGKLLIRVLHQLGAYSSAYAFFSKELLLDEQMQLIYAEILIRSGDAEQASSFIKDCLDKQAPRNGQASEDVDYRGQMGQLSDLCQLLSQNGIEEDRDQIPLYRLAELIRLAGKLGHPGLALKLAASDTDLQCLLVDALYQEGWTDEAQQLLSLLPDPLSLGSQHLHLQAAFISAELLHDEGRYMEARRIFDALIRRAPEMARARFGAASCCLHETMDNLFRRMELYHPADEEQRKINKYLDTIQQSLHILERSNWHTAWGPAQQRNLGIRGTKRMS